jgi:iron complex transport system substrate-binding protein
MNFFAVLVLLLFSQARIAPQRIISLAPGITEILFALDAGDRVVGDTTYCNFPEAAKTKPKVGGYTTPNLEAILALRPNQVIMMKNRPDVAQKLRQTGIEVVELQPENVAGIYDAIQVIAQKIGVPEKGRSLTQSIQKQLHDLADRTTATPKPKVLFVVGRSPGSISDLYVVGRGSYLSELIALAGADNVLDDSLVPYPQISIEEVIRRNPDVIIDMGHNEMVTGAQKEAVRQLWKKFSVLRAVQRNSVFPVSADYFVTQSPRVVLAVRDIQEMIRSR